MILSVWGAQRARGPKALAQHAACHRPRDGQYLGNRSRRARRVLRCSKLGRWLGGLWAFEPPAPGTATSTIARSCGYSNPTREPRETTRRDAGNSLEPPRRKVGAAAQRAARYLSAGGLTRKLLVLRPRAPRRPLVAASGSTPGRNCARTVVPATLPRATYRRSRRPVLEGARRPRGGLPQHSRCFLDRYA